MTKFEQLDTMLEQGNGYITTRAVTAQGISKPYFAEYARSREQCERERNPKTEDKAESVRHFQV